MNEDIRVVEVFKRIECHNPVSGHRWTEQGDFMYYQVHGGRFPSQKFKSLEKAVEEAAWRRAFNEKFPY